MNITDLRTKHAGERAKLLVELQDKMRHLRFDLALREARNHSDYRKLKKNIARLLTLEQEEAVSLDETPKEA